MSEEGDSNQSFPIGVYSSPVVDRNPSPPPTSSKSQADDDELSADICIGGTVFSKHWVFTTLMKLIKEVDKEDENTDNIQDRDESMDKVQEERKSDNSDKKFTSTDSVVGSSVSFVSPTASPKPSVGSGNIGGPTSSPRPAVRSTNISGHTASPSLAVQSTNVSGPTASPIPAVGSTNVSGYTASPRPTISSTNISVPTASPSLAVRCTNRSVPTASPCPSSGPHPCTSAGPIDIDEDIENELCKLWDMSMNQNVAVFLHEWKMEDILVSVIAKTNAPRATEICVGILANMACNEDIVIDMSKKDRLIEVVLALLECTDPPTLVETTRLIYSCISNNTAASYWLSTMKSHPGISSAMCFVLQSSTNGDLLHNMSDLVDKLLDMDDDLLNMWSSSTLLLAICEAIQQVSKDRPKTLEFLLHTLQLLSTTERGAEALVDNGNIVCPLITEFLNTICSEEAVTVIGRETELSAAVLILDTLITSKSNGIHYLETNDNLARYLLAILSEIRPILRRPSSSSSTVAIMDEERIERRKAKRLQSVILEFLTAVLETQDGNVVICKQLKTCPENRVKSLKGALRRKGVEADVIQSLEWEL